MASDLNCLISKRYPGSMIGMGMGRGNSKMRAFRIGVLVLVLLAGVVFHHSGPTYDAIRILYYAFIIGFLVFAFRSRRQGVGGPPRNSLGNSWNRSNSQRWGGMTNQTDSSSAPINTRLLDRDSDKNSSTPGAENSHPPPETTEQNR